MYEGFALVYATDGAGLGRVEGQWTEAAAPVKGVALRRLITRLLGRMFRSNEKPGCDTGPIANINFVK